MRTPDDQMKVWAEWVARTDTDYMPLGWAQTMFASLEAERRRADRAEAKVQCFEERYPCDEGCVEAPEETCSRDGRTPRELWDIIAKQQQEFRELASHQPSIWGRTGGYRDFLRCDKCKENYPCTTVRRAGGEF